MKTPGCTRRWAVEPARDGALGEDERRRVLMHVETCPDCAAEKTHLETLGARLREAHAESAHELSLRRVRHRLLARADVQSGRRGVRLRRWTRLILGGLSLAMISLAAISREVIAGAGIAWPGTREAPPRLAMQIVEPLPAAGARWTESEHAGAHELRLDEGTLALTVRRTPQDPPVVLHVPDGRIEDVGTIFRVTVLRGITTAIEVTEGEVMFHRADGIDIRVAEGMNWPPPDAGSTPPMRQDEPPAVERASAPPLRARAPPRLAPAATAPRAELAPIQALPSSDAADEDAAYLHLLALEREARSEEARLAARVFLQRFPAAFRRVEVERLAR